MPHDVAGALGLTETGLFTNEAMTENLAWYAPWGYRERTTPLRTG